MTAPESVLPNDHEWATHVPSRRPQFKTHSKLAYAKNAINNFQGPMGRGGVYDEDMVLYRLSPDGRYEPHLKIVKGSRREDYPLLAPKPVPLSDRMRELGSLESSLRYHEKAAQETRAKIIALKLELGL